MSRVIEFLRRVALLLRRDAASRELEEEMRLHRELRAETLHAQGMHGSAAAAVRRFGNVTITAERSRDAWGFGSLDDLMQDVRYAVRRLRQRPGFALSVVGVLALGIGATTAMFSAVDAAMLRPLPFVRPNELVTLNFNVPSSRRWGNTSERERTPDFTDALKMQDTYAQVAAYASGAVNLADPNHPMRVKAGVVTPGFFATLGVFPVHGRAFSEAEGKPDAPGVVILSWGLWQRQYGGADVLGQTISINARQFQVVGVMPRRFGFPEGSELWIPMSVPTTSATFEPFRGYLPSTTIARLTTGISMEAARGRNKARWEQFFATLPVVPGRVDPNIENMKQRIRAYGGVGELRGGLIRDQRRPLLILLGATALLLLIACANVTNLLLAYGATRKRELAVRGVLGATRGRVVRQLLAESVVLSSAGAVVGIALAPLLLRTLTALMPASLSGLAAARIDMRVLAFAAALGVLTGIVFGLWPAFGATRGSAAATIKSGGGHGASSHGAWRVQHALVGAELALTVMLLVGAGLMLRSFDEVMRTESGMSVEQTASLELSFARSTADGPGRRAKVDAMLDRLRSVPGITAAGVINDLPLRGGGGIAISIEVDGAAKSERYSRFLMASEDYFLAMGIPLLHGRFFTRSDNERVAIIDETMANQYWPRGSAVGGTFRWGGDSVPVTVVGVVGNVREGGLEEEPSPQMYFPAHTMLDINLALVARGSLPPSVLMQHMTDAVRAVDRSQAVYNVRMMRDVVSASVAPRRANTLLISLFGAIALLISVLGVYAVTAYAVAQRSREFGIRSALGATRRDLLRHVGSHMIWVALVGVSVGAGLAWALARVMSKLLYGITAHDAMTFALAPLALVAATLAAALIPARRAARVNPVEVMRND